MDVNTRISVGNMLSSIRGFQEEIENLKEDLDYCLAEVNKILTDNGEKPVTIDEIMKSDKNVQERRPRYRRYV